MLITLRIYKYFFMNFVVVIIIIIIFIIISHSTFRSLYTFSGLNFP